MSKNVYQAIRAHVSGEYRTETLHGKEYIVVPVVALVEGVLQGMSSEGPELALADEFGRFPASWDGRPLVMSHPVDGKGIPVSANTPETLEAYQIGFIFNTKVTKKKLMLEAWVDPTLMTNLNDDSKETLETLQKGEMIEVSTGYFAMVEQASGMHNNQEYDGIQRDIVPDHLAFLPNGTTGACSNADGCGAKLAVNSSPEAKFVAVKDFRTEVSCCDSCASGGTCEDEGHKDPKANTTAEDPNTPKAKEPEDHQESTNTDGDSATGNEEQSMTTNTKETGKAPATQAANANATNTDVVEATKKEPRTDTITNEQGTLEVNFDAEGKAVGFKLTPTVNEKKPQSVEEFIAQAPAEMQEVMKSSLKLHSDKKAGTIKALKDSGRCKFSDEQLNAMSLGDLENLAELANVPSYAGQALPHTNASTSQDDDVVTPAPLVFEAPAAANAA